MLVGDNEILVIRRSTCQISAKTVWRRPHVQLGLSPNVSLFIEVISPACRIAIVFLTSQSQAEVAGFTISFKTSVKYAAGTFTKRKVEISLSRGGIPYETCAHSQLSKQAFIRA